ncbi:DUF3298 domain-containing protein [bacterium]|nr:DUF3298 domain-containing protein [bacterium]
MKPARFVPPALLLFAGVLSTPSCTSCQPESDPVDASDTLVYTIKTLDKVMGTCDSLSTEPCAKVHIEYFEPTEGVPDSVLRRIQSIVQGDLGQYDSPESPGASGMFDHLSGPERTAALFIEEYSAMVKELPEFITPWELDITASIHFNQSDFLGYTILVYAYTGGAHGNSGSRHRCIHLPSGDTLGYVDLLVPDQVEAFTQIAEQQFRTQNEIADPSLNAAGFWFDEDRFYVSKNFFLSKDGVHFQYSQYEIAPYSMGQPEFVVDWKTIAPYLGARFQPLASTLQNTPES